MKPKSWKKWLLTIIKISLFLLACYFIYEIIEKNLTALKSIEIKNNAFFVGILLASILFYVALMMVLVFAWVVLLGFQEPQRSAKVYFKSQIMKYLPGNVFHFAYRHHQTKSANISHKQLGMTTAYESIVLVISALLISHLLFLWPEQITWLTNHLPIPIWALLLIEVVGCMLLLKMLPGFGFLTTLFSYFVYFAGMGLINYLLISALGFESQPYLFITACFALAWLAGYLIPGAPGGTGIREIVFIMLCAPKMAEYEALLIIALTRLISIVAESLIYFMASKLSQPYRHFSTWSGKTMP
ncbi:hypothetical protein [Marinicella meishanensis]|uniref:hypothetical protein n=1 Tax=Marinicella meishanensis TaxID=2873263 RepID=UPI001CBB767D|nr:hypothetical protein [Marinicella sp. NBU2979]